MKEETPTKELCTWKDDDFMCEFSTNVGTLVGQIEMSDGDNSWWTAVVFVPTSDEYPEGGKIVGEGADREALKKYVEEQAQQSIYGDPCVREDDKIYLMQKTWTKILYA